MVTFKGGIHPDSRKEDSFSRGIEECPVPAKVVIPLSQHAGKPAKPVVNVRDSVKKGQKIGESDGFISLPVHSSVSGTVVDICSWPHPAGCETLSVVIESDGNDETAEDLKVEKPRDHFRMSPDEIRKTVCEAGIAGLGGAAFPSHVKLAPPAEAEIETVILNGCECEPYLTCDYRLMLEYPREILEGLRIIMFTVGADSGMIAVEDNKPDAVKILEREIKLTPNINLEVVKTKYPQGAEKQLIHAMLARTIPSGKLPLDVGVVVHNVGTALAIRNAVKRGMPLTERIITVAGSGIKRPANLKVRIGTMFRDIIERCGGFSGEPKKIIAGGPMMGIAQYTTDVPVVKGTSGILVFNKEEKFEEKDCIRCGRCVEACPMDLMPCLISRYTEYGRWDVLEKYNVFDCIECGVCAYVCPAKRNIVQSVKIAKTRVKRKN